MDDDLPAECAVDAVNDELISGFGCRVKIVSAGETSFVQGRNHGVLEVDRDLERQWHAVQVLAGLAGAIRRAGIHGLEFVGIGAGCAAAVSLAGSVCADRLAAMENAATASSLIMVVIIVSYGAHGGAD